MKSGKKSILYLLLVLSLVFFAGCSGNTPEKEPEEKQEKQEEKEQEPEIKAIGTESEGANVYTVKIKNVTGQDIIGVAIKDMDAKEFPENMLADGDAFAADEERNLFWAADADSQASDEEADPDEKVVIPGWDVRITLADGNSFVLHAFPFEEMKEGELHVEDGVAFVTYTCDVNTKEAEIMVKKQEEEAKKKAAEEKAKKEAEEKAAAEAAAAEAAAEAAAAQQQQQQQQPAQSSEQCIGGGGLTY